MGAVGRCKYGVEWGGSHSASLCLVLPGASEVLLLGRAHAACCLTKTESHRQVHRQVHRGNGFSLRRAALHNTMTSCMWASQ